MHRETSYEMHNKSSDSDSDTIINSTCARKKKRSEKEHKNKLLNAEGKMKSMEKKGISSKETCQETKTETWHTLEEEATS